MSDLCRFPKIPVCLLVPELLFIGTSLFMQSQFGSCYAIKWTARQSTLFSPLSSILQGVINSAGIKTGACCQASELLYRLWRGRGEEE